MKDKLLNINNYEEWAIDFIDGNLTNKEEATFLDFISQNPDIKSEMEDLSEFTLTPNPITYQNRESLYKKNIGETDPNSFELLCIKSIEGILNNKEELELEELLLSAENKETYNKFCQTKLSSTDTYTKKSGLYKELPIRTLSKILVPIAASLLLIFSLSINNDDKPIFLVHNTVNSSPTSTKNITTQKKAEVSPENKIAEVIQTSTVSAKTASPIVKSTPVQNKAVVKEIEPLKLAKLDIKTAKIKNNTSRSKISANGLSIKNISASSTSEEELNFANRYRKNVLGESDPNAPDRLNAADIFDTAVTGIGRLTGVQANIRKEYDSDGNIKNVKFEMENINHLFSMR